jgi:exoribonuclease R
MGFPVPDTRTAGSLNAYLGTIEKIAAGTSADLTPIQVRAVLESLATRPMQQAKYFVAGQVDDPKEWSHYALDFALYTHFTSPIRRYADCIVHRLLAHSLLIEQQKQDAKTKVVVVPGTAPSAPAASVVEAGDTKSFAGLSAAGATGAEKKDQSGDKKSNADRKKPAHGVGAGGGGPHEFDFLVQMAEHCNKRKADAKKCSDQCDRVLYVILLVVRHVSSFLTTRICD